MHAAAAPSKLDAAIVYNAISRYWIARHNRTTRNDVRNCTSKTGSRRQSKKTRLRSTFQKEFKRKITGAKIEKICWQSTIAASMQPLHYDLRCPAAKDNSIMHAAAAPSNLDAAIGVYNAILRYWTAKHNRTSATAWEIAPPKPDLGAKAKKRFWTLLKRNFRKITSA